MFGEKAEEGKDKPRRIKLSIALLSALLGAVRVVT
jgi:hypothetical protein